MQQQSSTNPNYLDLKPAVAALLLSHSLKDLLLCLADLCDFQKDSDMEQGNGVNARQWASLSDCMIRAVITADELSA
jgi:hypothetical protein